jgi:hypothetical protein
MEKSPTFRKRWLNRSKSTPGYDEIAAFGRAKEIEDASLTHDEFKYFKVLVNVNWPMRKMLTLYRVAATQHAAPLSPSLSTRSSTTDSTKMDGKKLSIEMKGIYDEEETSSWSPRFNITSHKEPDVKRRYSNIAIPGL